MPKTVDEERRRPGRSAVVGALDITRHAKRMASILDLPCEAFDVEPKISSIGTKIREREGVLMLE